MAKQSNNYINADELKKELIAFRESKTVSEDLGAMFLAIAQNMIHRKNFINYTFKEEMIGRACHFMCKYSKSFDETKSNANPFAYVSQICYFAFIQCIKEENKHYEMQRNYKEKSEEKTELERFLEKQKGSLYE